jgi:2-amino-4-hydroxy-6-hydroxymethyldihydropteridine diphosphokinase
VSAAIHAAKSRVYLALGSNLGDRPANLRSAVEAMPPTVQPTAFSTIYETPPWGVLDQPAFLNQVICAKTALAPLALLDYLKQLELDLGRQPGLRYGPRLIDLDILLYDDLVFEDPRLSIPHPRLAERAFVLVPLNDIAPDLRHPVLGVSMAQLLAGLDTRGIKPYLD